MKLRIAFPGMNSILNYSMHLNTDIHICDFTYLCEEGKRAEKGYGVKHLALSSCWGQHPHITLDIRTEEVFTCLLLHVEVSLNSRILSGQNLVRPTQEKVNASVWTCVKRRGWDWDLQPHWLAFPLCAVHWLWSLELFQGYSSVVPVAQWGWWGRRRRDQQ